MITAQTMATDLIVKRTDERNELLRAVERITKALNDKRISKTLAAFQHLQPLCEALKDAEAIAAQYQKV